MNSQEKLNYIYYNGYNYSQTKFSASETNDFFDLDFTKLLHNNLFNCDNSQQNLTSVFDFSEIFSDFEGNQVNERQRYLLEFFVINNVNNVDSLLSNMPRELEFSFFNSLYNELKLIDNQSFWFSYILFCLKKEDRIDFFNNSIDELSDNEILKVIRELYEQGQDLVLSKIMNNERAIDVAVKLINPPFFYEMIEELNLPNSTIDKRNRELRSILTNYKEYDIEDVKQVFCDLYLHDTLNNALIDIKTVIECAEDDVTIREKIGDDFKRLCNMYEFLKGDNKDIQSSEAMINENDIINYEKLAKYYLMCQQRFKELVDEAISKDITENIEPRIVKSSSGKDVKVYDIENQTERQRHFVKLISTLPLAKDAKIFKQTYYSKENSEYRYNRRSCSLINEKKLLALYGGKNRIAFGYNDIKNRIITSATVGKGATDGNENKYRRHRKSRKSSYISLDKFIDETQNYTEVTVNKGQADAIMVPNYILTTNDNPTTFEIDVAAEFNIPIQYVKLEKYKQEPTMELNLEQYLYYLFERTPIQRLRDRKENLGMNAGYRIETPSVSSGASPTKDSNEDLER